MLFFLHQHRIMPVSSIPEDYQAYLLPGTEILSWTDQGVSYMAQKIELGSIELQYIVGRRVSGGDPELLWELSDSGFVLSLEGNWNYWIAAGEKYKLPEGYCYFFDHKAIRIWLSAQSGLICRLLCMRVLSADPEAVLRYPERNAGNGFAGDQLGRQPRQASAAMLEWALQLTQTSYLPEPRQFHRILAVQLMRGISGFWDTPASPGVAFNLASAEAMLMAKRFILSNLDKNFSLEELSRHCGINREQLRTGFQSMFKMSPYTFLRTERLELAKQLLRHTNRRIKQIARDSGYRQMSNFCTAFRRYTGMSPAQFRKMPEPG
ncbi:MAG TPA: AraC family transcriptional regulator [Sediminibacterium sp.]|nr:AraC family transcriptional regulator [Sediminibacterium sp.]